jgi:hypothetical protein
MTHMALLKVRLVKVNRPGKALAVARVQLVPLVDDHTSLR